MLIETALVLNALAQLFVFYLANFAGVFAVLAVLHALESAFNLPHWPLGSYYHRDRLARARAARAAESSLLPR